MYFALVFKVISRACFPSPFIVSSMLLLVSSTYTVCSFLHIIHACGSYYTVYTYSGLSLFVKSVISMSIEQEQTEAFSHSTDTPQQVDGSGNLAAVDQVFSMFKDYLEKKLDDKGKQIEQKSKIDKDVVQLKYKGNQKQFDLNAQLDTIIENIATESNCSEPNIALIKKHTQDARQLIRKRQKVIKIADKSKDCGQVVAEYE